MQNTIEFCLIIVSLTTSIGPLHNPRTYTQTPTVVQRGWVDGNPPPLVFDMLQCFNRILPSVESLWSSLHSEVYFVVGGTAGFLWQSSQNKVAILASRLGFIKNLRLTCKITHNYLRCIILSTSFTFSVEKSWQLQKTSGADVLLQRKKIRKTLRHPPPPLPYIWG